MNRIAKYGYEISFHDPSLMDPDLEEAVRAIMAKSRRGEVERGFSMTLGRIFDRRDQGLTARRRPHGPDGSPVAFCQFVPAPGINGVLARPHAPRTTGSSPNGLLDFILVRTIERHRARAGDALLGLNFARHAGRCSPARRGAASSAGCCDGCQIRCRSSPSGASTPSSGRNGCPVTWCGTQPRTPFRWHLPSTGRSRSGSCP